MTTLSFPINTQNIIDINSYIDSPSHAVLLSANSGFGVDALARELARMLSSNYVSITPEKTTKTSLPKISVANIRDLYTYANQKSVGKKVFCILSADKMTQAAQNAFLKLLEEPLDNTNFILASENYSKLLPTIKSRVQTMHLKNLSNKQSLILIEKVASKTPEKQKQIQFLSRGLPGEINKLASDKQYFDYRSEIIRDGRTLLTGSLYEKLLVIKKHKDDRESALRLIDDILLILQNSLASKVSKDMLSEVETWMAAREKILANSSVRLTLMAAVV